jgi:glycosyltransferase involved in cell wall biosynthesis
VIYSKKMNLLIISNNLNRAGFKQRIAVYLDTLRANGIDCEVAKLPSGPWARRKFFKRAAEFDLVLLHKKGLNPFDAFWLRRYSKKLIYHFDDAIMYSDKTPERNRRSHFVPFRRSVRIADMVIAGSTYLAQQAKPFNPNVVILPTGINISDYNVERPFKDDDKIRLVWIGSLSTLKYLEQIKSVPEAIGARFKNVVMRIICDDFIELESMSVEKRLWSKETRGVDLATSDIGLAPLPDNRFTRGKCSFKVFEYSAAGLPVVASPVGTNSEYVRDNVTGFLVTDTRQWIDRITELIKNPELRQKMGWEGLAFAQKFDLSIIGQQFAELIKNCHQDNKLQNK